MPGPSSPSPIRRSTRVHVRVPVTVSGTLPDGKPFNEEAQILTISKFGAKLKTQHPLKVGMHLKVKPKFRQQTGIFRVVWIGIEGTPRAGEAGIEYIEVSNLLGITFPE